MKHLLRSTMYSYPLPLVCQNCNWRTLRMPNTCNTWQQAWWTQSSYWNKSMTFTNQASPRETSTSCKWSMWRGKCSRFRLKLEGCSHWRDSRKNFPARSNRFKRGRRTRTRFQTKREPWWNSNSNYTGKDLLQKHSLGPAMISIKGRYPLINSSRWWSISNFNSVRRRSEDSSSSWMKMLREISPRKSTIMDSKLTIVPEKSTMP